MAESSMNSEEELKALREALKEKTPVPAKVILLQRNYPNISPVDLENILETLTDWDCLNDRGKTLRHRFWEVFIKE